MCPHNAATRIRVRAPHRAFAALASVGVVFALAFITACKTTPLDVVYAVDVAGVGDAGAGAVVDVPSGAGAGGAPAGGASSGGTGGTDAGACSVVGAGRYVLRSQANLQCLGQGAPTTVFGNPGFLLNFDTECRVPARSWQLSATAIPNAFSFQNLSSGFVLDVQMAGTREGTPVITYGETGYDNQRFEVRARDAFVSELRPLHHPQSCVSATLDGSAQIATCDPTDPTQAWQFQRSDCL